jgi:chromosome segregation ATPase
MSTAGKVLVVLIMLSSLLWVILTAGVTQLNRNGNQALVVLAERAAKLEEDAQSTKEQVAQVKDQTTVLQEKMDRDLAVINARQIDAQRMSSSIREVLSRVQFELASVQQTLQNADKDRTVRVDEKAAEEKALAQARQDVTALKATDEQLTGRLKSLRDEFSKTYQNNKATVATIGHH